MEQILANAWNDNAVTSVYGKLYFLQAPATAVVPYSIAYRVGSIEQPTKDDVLRENAEVSMQIHTYTSAMLQTAGPMDVVQENVSDAGRQLIIEQMIDEYEEDRDIFRKIHFVRIF